MRKGTCGVFVFCFMASNAWVCVAKEPQCKIAHEYKGCSDAQIAADKTQLCNATDGQDGDDGRSTGVTTTTLPTDQLDGGLPTPCPQYQITVRCRWSNKSGTKGKHCTVTDQRLFSAQCGVVSQRRDGSRVFRYCVLRGF